MTSSLLTIPDPALVNTTDVNPVSVSQLEFQVLDELTPANSDVTIEPIENGVADLARVKADATVQAGLQLVEDEEMKQGMNLLYLMGGASVGGGRGNETRYELTVFNGLGFNFWRTRK